MGSGRFVAPKTLEVALNAGGTRTLRGKNVIINTGSRAKIDSTPGLLDAKPLTHVEAAGTGPCTRTPACTRRRLRRVGTVAGDARFGSHVTIVERNGALIHREDSDVTEAIEQLFHDEGIDVLKGSPVQRVEGRSGESVRLHTARV